MDFNNNPLLYPKERGLNPLTPIVERLSTLEGVVKNYGDSFETKELKVESLKEEEPILSNAVVGYNNEGKEEYKLQEHNQYPNYCPNRRIIFVL